MEFTPQEQKMIARLRKRQLQWLRLRWWMFITGVLQVAASAYVFYFINDLVQSSSPNTIDLLLVEFVCFYPIGLLMMLAGGFNIVIALRDWHGNAQETLLLSLIERSNEESEGSPQN